MSTLFDKSRLYVQLPGERTAADAPSSVDAAQVDGRAVVRDDRGQENKPATSIDWRQFIDAINQFKATWVAPEAPGVAAPAPPSKDMLPESPFDAVAADAEAASGVDPALMHGPLVAPDDGVQQSEPDTTSIGYQLLKAIRQFNATWVAPEALVVAVPVPTTRDGIPASLFNLDSVVAAVDQATTLDEVMAAVKTFADSGESVLKAASDPRAALTAMFGSECVATVTEACTAAVVALEVETAVTGSPPTERAAIRIVRGIVDRVTQRAARTMALAPRARVVLHGRTGRAPRARRAPRRAVRLSAVASAGDGPPPRQPPAATRALRGARSSLASGWIVRAVSTEVVDVDDTVERAIEASL
jgi:hypothetical protein